MKPNNFPKKLILDGTEELYTQTNDIPQKFTLELAKDYVNTIIEATYVELEGLVSNQLLKTGSYYLLTDFETIYDRPDYEAGGRAGYQPKSTILTVNSGVIEPLLLLAISEDEFATQVYSQTFPDDYLEYDFGYNITPINSSPAKGRIIRRRDTDNNETNYDHRTITFKRYDRSGDGIYVHFFDSGTDNSVLLPTFGTNARNNKFERLDYKILPSFIGFGFGLFDLENNVFGDDCVDNEFGYLFYLNTIDGGFISNRIGNEFNKNIIGKFFQSNIIENNFFSNTIGSGFDSNIIGNNFFSNIIGNSFNSNTIDNFFQQNTIGNDFNQNKTANTFSDNTIGDNFEINTIAVNFFNNTLGNNFSYNTIGNDFNSNIVGNDFQLNTTKAPLALTDFSLATYVYANYNCEIFKRSNNTLQLSYIDASNTVIYDDITD
jgi:hypothetical protein